jgi:hypothetical protein
MRRLPIVFQDSGELSELQSGDSLNISQLFVDDFVGTTLLAIYGTMQSGAGTSGAINVAGVLTQGVIGVLTLNSGAGATGARGVNTGQNLLRIGGKGVGFGCSWYLPVVSDATNRFTVRIGMSSAVTTVGDSTGIYFRYNDSVAGGVIQGVCRNGVTETVVNSTVVPVANTVYECYLYVNPLANSVSFYVNEVLIGTVTTNIVSSATPLGLFALIQKSVGGTARQLCLDEWYSEVVK